MIYILILYFTYGQPREDIEFIRCQNVKFCSKSFRNTRKSVTLVRFFTRKTMCIINLNING